MRIIRIITFSVILLLCLGIQADDEDIVKMHPADVNGVTSGETSGSDYSLEEFQKEYLLRHRQEQEERASPVTEDIHSSTHSRYNFASFDCGAKVIGSNPEANHASAVLIEDRDRYMLNQCDAKKWLIFQLCDEILMDTIEVANFEYYSSMFKDFQVLGSGQYPTEKWILLGNFRAENKREAQQFKLTRPTWTRFIKLRFVTHHGSEYFCPVSHVRVWGVTAAEDIKNDLTKSTTSENAVSAPMIVDNTMDDIVPVSVTNVNMSATHKNATPSLTVSATAVTNHGVASAAAITVGPVSSSPAATTPPPTQTPPASDPVAPVEIPHADPNTAVIIIPAQNISAAHNSSPGNGNGAGGPANATSAMQQHDTHENIFKILSKTIRALEINMSASTAFTERLNKRLSQEMTDLRTVMGELATRTDVLTVQMESTTENVTSLMEVMLALSTRVQALNDLVVHDSITLRQEIAWFWRSLLAMLAVGGAAVIAMWSMKKTPPSPEQFKVRRKFRSASFMSTPTVFD